MSNTVDNRIVEMKIDNTQLQSGAAESISILDRLKASLNFTGAVKGLEDVSRTASGMNMGVLEDGVLRVNAGFAALATIAVTTLSDITSKAISTGTQLVKSLTVTPIGQGFSDYNLKLTSVKTVMNTTGKSISQVSKYFDQLDVYADKTIFNLSDMTGAFAKFTNAGISMKKAIPMIKGISNMTALAGQGADAAGIAYYNLSQSLAGGFLTTTDYKSLNLANVATLEWKKRITNAAVAAGTLKKVGKDMYQTIGGPSSHTLKMADLFNQGLSDQWASAKVLTKVLGDYGNETTKIGKKALGAAQDVKSLPMMLDTLKAAVGTGWTDTFQILLGDVNESTTLFTGLTNSIGGFLSKISKHRNELLQGWKDLGGRKDLIQGLKNVFQGLGSVLKPIGQAFREIFPATTAKQLADVTHSFLLFSQGLTLSGPHAEALKQTFKGLFALLDIGVRIIKAVVGNFFDMTGALSGGSGSILDLTAGIAGLIIGLRDWLVEGDKLGKFFDGLQQARENVLRPVVVLISSLISAFAALTTGGVDAFWASLGQSMSNIGPIFAAIVENVQAILDHFSAMSGLLPNIDLAGIFGGILPPAKDASDGIDGVKTSLEGASDAAAKVDDVFKGVGKALVAVKNFVVAAAHGIAAGFVMVKDAISQGLDGVGLQDGLAVINTGFLTLLYFSIRKFVKQVGGVFQSMKNTFGAATGVLKQVTSNLKSMQTEVRARAILLIAAALALLAGALYVLSKIDTKELAQSLGAVVILLIALTTAIKVLEKQVGEWKDAGKMVLIAGAMVLIAGAILALSLAVALLGRMDTKTLAKGLGSVAAILAFIVGASALLEKSGGATQMIAAATAIGILAFALTALAGALELYAALDTKTMAEGGAKIAVTLIVLDALMRGIPGNIKGSAALLIMAAALFVIAGALKVFATMSAGEIAKSLIVLAGALGIISMALILMEEALPGAAALIVAAGAIAILVPSMIALGNLPIKVIAIALGAMAGMLAIFIAAAYLAAPVAPILLALAGAIALFGLGVAAIGGGVLLLSAGLAALAVSGLAGVAVLTAAVIAIAELLPLIALQFGLAIKALAVVIAKSGPELMAAFSTVLTSLILAITNNIPKFGKMLLTLITTGLTILRTAIPKYVSTGIAIILAILRGVADNIGKIVNTVGRIITTFIKALGDQLPKILDAGAKFIVKFINGLATAIDDNSQALADAGQRLAVAIIEGMVKGLLAGPKAIIQAASELGHSAISAIGHAIHAHSPSKDAEKLGRYVGAGFAIGLIGGQDQVDKTLDEMKSRIKTFFDSTASDIKSKTSELEKLRKDKKADPADIAKAEKQLKQLKALHEEAKNARKTLNVDLKDEQKQLRVLSKQYDQTTKDIEDATKALEDAKKTRDDFATSTADTYGALPAIGADETFSSFADKTLTASEAVEKFQKTLETLKKKGLSDETYNQLLKEGTGAQGFLDRVMEDGKKGIAELNSLGGQFATQKHTALDDYTSNIEKQAGDVEKFKGSLDQLKALGLSDDAYKQLVSEGVSAQPFVDELLNSGGAGIDQINALNDRLKGAATALGDEAAKVLYQGGVDAAQKTLDGLEHGMDNPTSLANIKKKMGNVAKIMVREIKKELKIKSPSRVFEEIGKYSNHGLANGLAKYSHVVSKAGVTMANTAVDAIQMTMRGVDAAILTEVNTTPVIAPVLDLSQIKSDADKLNAIMDTSTSYGHAMSISTQQQDAADSSAATTDGGGNSAVEFTQNNYSPKALSPSEVYRNTKNALSLLEKELSTP